MLYKYLGFGLLAAQFFAFNNSQAITIRKLANHSNHVFTIAYEEFRVVLAPTKNQQPFYMPLRSTWQKIKLEPGTEINNVDLKVWPDTPLILTTSDNISDDKTGHKIPSQNYDELILVGDDEVTAFGYTQSKREPFIESWPTTIIR